MRCSATGIEVLRADHDIGAAAPRFEALLPPAFPVPAIPPDNPHTRDKAELGRFLFYDHRLSGNQTYSCASCHQQRLAFTDGRARALGSTGELHPRSAMSLTNVAYNASFTWADPGVRSLEDQALVPMYNRNPVELGLAGREEQVLGRLRADTRYRKMFHQTFPNESEPIRIGNVVRAIASFERSLISGNSPYDRYAYQGDAEALAAPARHGMELFFSERLACFRCHSGFNFSGPVQWHERPARRLLFHNTGLYNLARGAYPAADRGLVEHTGRPRDMGRFRAPTLRNIELTAPYMHDGSIQTLEGVIDHYASGGRTLAHGPHAGVGRRNRYKSRLVRRQSLTGDEKAALVAFLKNLTDWDFVRDPRFADPFESGDLTTP